MGNRKGLRSFSPLQKSCAKVGICANKTEGTETRIRNAEAVIPQSVMILRPNLTHSNDRSLCRTENILIVRFKSFIL